MALDPTTGEGLAHLAGLARLALAPEEAQAFSTHFGKLLSWVEVLAELDEEPQAEDDAQGEALVLRSDEVCSSLPPAEALSNAPAQASGAFLVPAVLGE